MPEKPAAVVDTSVFIRFLLESPSALELWEAFRTSTFKLLYSESIFEEFRRVCSRPELGILASDAAIALASIGTLGLEVKPTLRVLDCRDPEDNKFLECAWAGKAASIVSMDKDLLSLNPWRSIPILKPREFLMLLERL